MTAIASQERAVTERRTVERPSWAVMWRVELVKLTSQLKVRVVFLGCVLIPVAFAVMESTQSSVPGDTLFGRWVHESGFAVSLFLLAFCAQWGLPFLVAIVAGDACAEEDRLHTWPLILTRSQSRGAILAGKALAAGTLTMAGTLVLAASSTLSGVVVVGTQPLVGLSGSILSRDAALAATAASWVSIVPPVLAIAAIAILASVVSRNTWVGVVAPVLVVFGLNVVAQFSALDPIRPLLPTTGFDAWHGFVRTGVYTDQVWTSLVVSGLWIGLCLGVASFVFVRRDVVE